MPKKTKKPVAKEPKRESSPAPSSAPSPKDDRLALRLAVLEDVVKRAAQETRALQTKLDTLGATHGELARRVADVEKRAAR